MQKRQSPNNVQTQGHLESRPAAQSRKRQQPAVKAPDFFCRLGAFLILTFAAAANSGGIASAATSPPVLISQLTSTRAIALESVMLTSEPFRVNSRFSYAADGRTRVILFGLNLTLQPGDDLSVVTADAEDATHRHYSFNVEYLAPVPANQWMTAVVLRLNDDLIDPGDLLVRVSYRGVGSNRVRVGIGHVGGGLPDDDGAAPTPAPPYTIKGRVVEGGQGLVGVTVTLNGSQTQSVVTDVTGSYSFAVPTIGDYALTAQKTFFNLSPPNRSFIHLSNHQTNVNFDATRQTYAIEGVVRDDNGQGFNGNEVALLDENNQIVRKVTTGGGGMYLFAGLPAGFSYSVKPTSTSIFLFEAQHVNILANNVIINVVATRRTYSLSGKITNPANNGVAGVSVMLSGWQVASTTSNSSGDYFFGSLPAGRDYTITPITNPYYTFVPQTFNNLQVNQAANFAGVQRYYTVSGRVQVGPYSASYIVVPISGSQTGQTTANVEGEYSFTLPAGGNYAITPTLSYWDFQPVSQIVTDLTSDQINRNFLGVHQAFTISGRLTDQNGNALPRLTVNLTGARQEASVTNNSGYYQFTDLFAGYSYTVTPPSTASYTFYGQSVANLTGNQVFDFTGLSRLTLSGSVHDDRGNGIIGVKVTLAGTESATTVTAANGSYSLVATATGNYTVTPSVGQGYYTFAPAATQFNNLAGAQVADFFATLAPVPDPSYVLEFDGAPKTVDYGGFWQEGVNLGHFFWEFWAMPGGNAGATYMLSDGYGGAHALLFGFGNFTSSEPGRYQLLGNIFNGITYDNYFGSDQGPAVGEWAHFAVGWDGQNIITYYNGVPVGKKAFSGPRRTPGPAGGGGRLLIGGSDHSNFVGRIAQVRGYEDANPREALPGGVEASFAPQTVFGVGGNLLSYFFRPGQGVADLSQGYNGITHAGSLRGTTSGVLYDCGGCPPPIYVIDPSAPNFAAATAPTPVHVDSPQTAPAAALVFDSFSRPNSTYVFGGTGGLGATEGGTAGPQIWQTSQGSSNLKPFGILNGRGVLLGNATHLAWVTSSLLTGNLDIRVNRSVGRFYGSGYDTGLSFRVVDSQNYFFAYTSEDGSTANPRVLTVGYYLNNQRTNLVTGVNMPASWTTLRVISRETGSIQILADGIVVYSTSNGVNATASGAGLYNNSSGLGLLNRWDNFTIYNAP